jgi:hypothetical protein
MIISNERCGKLKFIETIEKAMKDGWSAECKPFTKEDIEELQNILSKPEGQRVEIITQEDFDELNRRLKDVIKK